jgi:hypothetical protein
MGDDLGESSDSEEPPYLFQLIENQKWSKLRRCLGSPRGPALCQEKDRSELTCLALALSYDAPLAVIQDLVSICPNLATAKDEYGATPLHLACLNGASFDCIMFMAQNYDESVRELDHDLRAPLHHAVEHASQPGQKDTSYTQVIELLCKAAPELIHMRDSAGDTPLDLVQIVKISTKISSAEYNRLHLIYEQFKKTSILVYRETTRQWELASDMRKMGTEKSVTGSVSESSKASSLVSTNTTAVSMCLSSADEAVPSCIDDEQLDKDGDVIMKQKR